MKIAKWYGDYVVVQEEKLSSDIVAGCVNELIKTFPPGIEIDWTSMKTIIKKTAIYDMDPISHIAKMKDGQEGKYWSIGIKALGFVKEDDMDPEET